MLRIYPTVFSGTLSAPPSKSHAQSLLFASSISNIPTTLYNVPESDDINTSIQCLEALGCKVIKQSASIFTVTPFVKTTALPTASFDFKNCATSSRFALAIAAAFGIPANCTAWESLMKRPLVQLASRMAIRGVTFSSFSFPLSIQGRLKNGEYIFSGEEGSQYINLSLIHISE